MAGRHQPQRLRHSSCCRASSTSRSWKTAASGELRTATWLFPLYLVAINIFVLPIAFAGLSLVGASTSSDLYVLSVPLLGGHDALAMIAFIGGLSAATAMVIVESVALAIMMSNDLVIPIFVRRLLTSKPAESEDWSALILNIRRISIFVILFAAFLYYRESTSNTRLAAIGLMSFAAIAQFAPAFFGGLIWRGANARGAALGLAAGFLMWFYTLLFPSLASPGGCHCAQRPVRLRGVATAGAVRHHRRAAEPRRAVEPVDQRAVLRFWLAVARLAAAGAHPGLDLRAARCSAGAEPPALPHRRHRQRSQGYDRPLPRRGAHRALVQSPSRNRRA
jgi:hypothetical protein